MSNATKAVSYGYNEGGLRREKTVTENGSTVTHQYIYAGSSLSADITAGYKLYFHYGADGAPLGFTCKTGESTAVYSYVRSLQGDIVGIVDASGAVVAEYSYDGWGKVLSSSGSMAEINPLRYRGYYYDGETELYYLQSRYYDPELGRFISSDNYATTYNSAIGANMFAYCLNNPVLHSDDEGTWVHIAVGALVGGIVGAVSSVITQSLTGDGTIDVVDVLIAAGSGAISGALAASGVGVVGQIAANAAIAAGGNAANQALDISRGRQEEWSWESFALDVGTGMVSGLIGGSGASHGSARSIMRQGQQLVRRISRGDSVIKAVSYYWKVARVPNPGTKSMSVIVKTIKGIGKAGAVTVVSSLIRPVLERR